MNNTLYFIYKSTINIPRLFYLYFTISKDQIIDSAQIEISINNSLSILDQGKEITVFPRCIVNHLFYRDL